MPRPRIVYSQYTTPMCLGLNTGANQDHNLCGDGKDCDMWGCNPKIGLWPSSFFKNQTNDEDKCLPGMAYSRKILGITVAFLA